MTLLTFFPGMTYENVFTPPPCPSRNAFSPHCWHMMKALIADVGGTVQHHCLDGQRLMPFVPLCTDE